MSLNLLNNSTLVIVSLIFGFLSIVLAIFFYIKGKKIKIPCFNINSYNVISTRLKNKVDDIEIYYSKNRIYSLTVSKIAIWNSGNDTIFRNDIPSLNKFKIIISNEYEIYDYELLPIKDKDNQVILTKNGKQIDIDFDFIEPKKGFIIKVIHSGNSSDCLTISGKVIGNSEIKQFEPSNKFKFPFLPIKITFKYMYLFLLTIYITLAIYISVINSEIDFIGFILVLIVLILTIRKFVEKDIPNQLRTSLLDE